jgi:hypothetical protein
MYIKLRLKEHPELYVGKSSPSAALRTKEWTESVAKDDVARGKYKTLEDALYVDFWGEYGQKVFFKSEAKAKVWTDLKTFIRFREMARRANYRFDIVSFNPTKAETVLEGGTFPHLEAVIEINGMIKVVPLDKVVL